MRKELQSRSWKGELGTNCNFPLIDRSVLLYKRIVLSIGHLLKQVRMQDTQNLAPYFDYLHQLQHIKMRI